MSLVPTEAPFTPIRSLWAAKKSICKEKGILRESGVNLGYLIINRHVLMSPIEKSRAFWSRREYGAGIALADRPTPRSDWELSLRRLKKAEITA